MVIAKCFRSGNTLRVTLPSTLRYVLRAQPGDLLYFKESSKTPGVIEVTNLSEDTRNEKRSAK